MTQHKIENFFVYGVIACLGLVLFLSSGCEKPDEMSVDRPSPSMFSPSPISPETKEKTRELKYRIIENKTHIDQLESQKLDVAMGFGIYEYFSKLEREQCLDSIDDEIELLEKENEKMNDEIVKLGGEPYYSL